MIIIHRLFRYNALQRGEVQILIKVFFRRHILFNSNGLLCQTRKAFHSVVKKGEVLEGRGVELHPTSPLP